MSERSVAVVGFAHAPHVRRTDGTTNGVEMLMPCFAQVYQDLGISKADEEALKASGCKIDRIAGEDEEDTRRMLDELVQKKQRFQSLDS